MLLRLAAHMEGESLSNVSAAYFDNTQPFVPAAGVCLRAGAATARWTVKTAPTSSTAPSCFLARSSPQQRWAASSVDCCWSSPWAARVNCTRSGPESTGRFFSVTHREILSDQAGSGFAVWDGRVGRLILCLSFHPSFLCSYSFIVSMKCSFLPLFYFMSFPLVLHIPILCMLDSCLLSFLVFLMSLSPLLT